MAGSSLPDKWRETCCIVAGSDLGEFARVANTVANWQPIITPYSALQRCEEREEQDVHK
jgi:hypothetical protein